MTQFGTVVGQLALPACLPVVIIVVMIGMARLEELVLEAGGRRIARRAPPRRPTGAVGRTGPAPDPVAGPDIDAMGELDEHRV